MTYKTTLILLLLLSASCGEPSRDQLQAIIGDNNLQPYPMSDSISVAIGKKPWWAVL